MKKIILSAIIALSAVVFTPSLSNAQKPAKPVFTLEPTNPFAAWSQGYQYGISHGWGEEDSLYWGYVQMQIWINNHN